MKCCHSVGNMAIINTIRNTLHSGHLGGSGVKVSTVNRKVPGVYLPREPLLPVIPHHSLQLISY